MKKSYVAYGIREDGAYCRLEITSTKAEAKEVCRKFHAQEPHRYPEFEVVTLRVDRDTAYEAVEDGISLYTLEDVEAKPWRLW